MKQKYEIIEQRLAPGQRLAVRVCSTDGRETNLTIELRSTPQPDESPGAFNVEIIEHSPERCNSPEGCRVIESVLTIPPEDRPAYSEILRQRKAEREAIVESAEAELIKTLEAVFGAGSIFTIDETGVHPASPKPPST